MSLMTFKKGILIFIVFGIFMDFAECCRKSEVVREGSGGGEKFLSGLIILAKSAKV